MLRHFKEFSGDDGGLIFLAEQFEKCLRITVGKPREYHRAGGWPKTFEVSTRIEEGVEERAIDCSLTFIRIRAAIKRTSSTNVRPPDLEGPSARCAVKRSGVFRKALIDIRAGRSRPLVNDAS